jgi:hypothetical protein
MSKEIRIAVAKSLGRELATAALAPAQPILSDAIAVQKFVEMDCGADGWTLSKGNLLALRDNGDGTHSILKMYEIDSFGQA